jgi:tetratricopeptide (TPR) repeat protein
MIKLTTLIMLLAAAGCGTVKSSVNYTKGTDALERGDYVAAIPLLEEAVRLGPKLSRNHNNLAYAYYQSGRTFDAWNHSRQAVMLEPTNEYAASNFERIFIDVEKKAGLELGDSSALVKVKLGEPDVTSDKTLAECGCFIWQYAFKALTIVDGELTAIQDMKYALR